MKTIESWEDLDQRLADLGLTIETGTEDWVERIVDHAHTLKTQRDAGFDFAQRVERYAHDTGNDVLWQKARLAIIDLRDKPK